MNIRHIAAAASLAVFSLGAMTPAHAAVIVADTVIDYFNSGANAAFPSGSYGGTFPGSFPVTVPLSYATDGNATTFVSLPRGSYLTLGFSGGFVFDGAGLDLFVSEVGGADEHADVYVSSDFGVTFTLLGQATTSTVSGFDLASIGYTGNVNAVKIVGLDSLGGSPGFDLAFVQGLEGSVVINPVPEPASLALVALGLLGAAAATRRHRG
jgi:PEP-CTERM motif